MLFNIFHLGVFTDVKGVYAVVPRLFFAAVMNTAARNYGNVGIFTHIKIIVNKVGKTGFAYNYRNMHILAHSARFNYNVYSGVIGLCFYINIFRNLAIGKPPVCTNVERTVGAVTHIGDYLQKLKFRAVHMQSSLSLPAVTRHPVSTVPSRSGKISAFTPSALTEPALITIILSAIFKMRSW